MKGVSTSAGIAIGSDITRVIARPKPAQIVKKTPAKDSKKASAKAVPGNAFAVAQTITAMKTAIRCAKTKNARPHWALTFTITNKNAPHASYVVSVGIITTLKNAQKILVFFA